MSVHRVRRSPRGRVVVIVAAAALAWGWSNSAWAVDFFTDGGYRWDIGDADGTIVDGTSDAYDGCFGLQVDVVRYDGFGTLDVVGRTQRFNTASISGLDVARQVYVPETGGDWVRYFDTFENPGSDPIEVTVRLLGNVGSDSSTAVWGTESGDLNVDETDSWWGSDDWWGAGDPTLGFAFFGDDAPITPAFQTLFRDDLLVYFSFVVEPGERIALLFFGFQGSEPARVLPQLEALVADVGLFVDDMDAADVATIVNWSLDADADGFLRSEGDCDDHDDAVFPGAPELCDGLDNDCDDAIDDGLGPLETFFRDADGDGFGDDLSPTPACTTPPGHVAAGGDCDDASATCFPGAPEDCDGVDDDCDGFVDDGVTRVCTVGSCPGLENCSAGGWGSCTPDPRDEVCNGLDDDCDGRVDEGVMIEIWDDADGDGFGDPTTTSTACEVLPDHVTNHDDCDDADARISPVAAERCDGVDEDCDGVADDGLASSTYYEDADHDGYGVDGSTSELCRPAAGWASEGGDCDDACRACHPGADELCDGLDNDCNDEVDDELDFGTWFADDDEDGFGDAATETVTCDPDPGWVEAAGDCDDACRDCYPGAFERCDERDNDCDGEVDEGDTIWADADGDGYGDPATGHESCDVPEGFVENGDDCDDACVSCRPGGEEVCDGLDNDCDGQADDEIVQVYAPDRDGDGYGDAARADETCAPSAGQVADASDCDDALAEINPAAAEVTDGVDNDCDGEVDEGLGAEADADVEPDADVDLEELDRTERGCGCRAAPAPSAFFQALVALLLG